MGCCRECRYFVNRHPFLIDGQPYGAVLEGDCKAPGTLHPLTYSWNHCHLIKRGGEKRCVRG